MPTRRTFVLGALSAIAAAACGKSAQRAGSRAAGPNTTGPPPGAPAAYIPHGPRTSTAVALTFHGSGDPALTDQMLALAAQLKAPITVFAVGQWLEQNPDISGKILAGGHELANHTYSHPTLS